MWTTDNEVAFASDEHKEHFANVIDSLHKVNADRRVDPEYGAAIFILTSTHMSLWEMARNHIRGEKIDFTAMMNQPLSSGEVIMLKLASHLFNEQTHIDPVELVRLDEQNFQLALSAIRLRRYGMHLEYDGAIMATSEV